MSTLVSRSRNALLDRHAHVCARNANELSQAEELADLREPDVLDAATSAEASSLLGHLADAHQRELKAIDRALRRMASGTWGTCTRCHARISASRLQALPETTTCIECADRAL